MKRFILLIVFIAIASFSFSQSPTDVKSNDDWTWLGIDYTHCYFLTKMDFPSVSDLESKIQAWNDLVLMEREKYIDKTLVGKNIDYYTDMVEELNEEIDVKSRLSNDGFLATHMEEVMIQEIVGGYNIPDELTGIGLIFIAESYSKPNVQGAYFVTFFDMETKRVLITERMLGKAKGFGLRNYWAGSYYRVLQEVGKRYK
jgi:hypothetical protein